MTTWIRTTAILCTIGFWKELRPTTPYLTPYLITAKNLSDETLYSQVYPFWTYSYALCLIPVFILTDVLRYKVRTLRVDTHTLHVHRP
jgi:thiamine transporter 2/3